MGAFATAGTYLPLAMCHVTCVISHLYCFCDDLEQCSALYVLLSCVICTRMSDPSCTFSNVIMLII